MHSLYLQVPWIDIIYWTKSLKSHFTPVWSHCKKEFSHRPLSCQPDVWTYTAHPSNLNYVHAHCSISSYKLWNIEESMIFRREERFPNLYEMIVLAVLNLPEACSFLKVATHLPPTVIPSTFHFLKWLFFNNITQYWCNMGICRSKRGTQVFFGMRFGFYQHTGVNGNFGMLCRFSHMHN